jgi:hypothetical protein
MALQVRGGPWHGPRPSRGTGCDRRELVLGLDGDTSDAISTGTGQTGRLGSGGNCPWD